MSIKAELRAAIGDLEAFSRAGLTRESRLKVDVALGHLYEAYAQAVLDERRLHVDIARICGFIRYIDAFSLKRLPPPLLRPRLPPPRLAA